MSSKKVALEEMIQAAVDAAKRVCETEIDKKIQEAINLGVTIGATAGAEVGAAAAVRAVERERAKYKKQVHDKRFHNTKLLLRNYRALNEHYHNAVFDVQAAEASDEDFADIMQAMNSTIVDEEIYVESIKQSCIRTKVIMAHVNKMLDIYKIMCERSQRADSKRRWRVLEALYIADAETTAGAVAEREHIDKRTVYKDIDACISDLTTLFFGIGGLEDR